MLLMVKEGYESAGSKHRGKLGKVIPGYCNISSRIPVPYELATRRVRCHARFHVK